MIRITFYKPILLLSICLLVGLLLSAQNTFHKEIPDLPSVPHLVNDFADMLSPGEEMQLETKLLNFANESSNEVSIVTVNDLGGIEVAEFALELGRKWDIGKEKKKNGVLLLASKNDRKINISPGDGLSGVLPDIICGRIIRDYIVPNFKRGDFYQGFDDATTAIISASKGEFTNDEFQNKKIPAGILILMFLFFFGFIFLFFYIRRKVGNIYVSRRGYKRNDDGWGSLLGSGGGWFNGGGGNSGGGGGGGFGGFGGGGGGFSGGGASGSW